MSRRQLKFIDATQVADEVLRLRRGYKRNGNWSLPQICWHLNIAVRTSMNPPADAKPVSKPELREKLRALLESRQVPAGLESPERAVPPVDAPEEAIDEFLATLTALHFFRGPFGPHRLFGTISFQDYVQFHMIHCAHHLGFLAPTGE
jgi:hypothetical protein